MIHSGGNYSFKYSVLQVVQTKNGKKKKSKKCTGIGKLKKEKKKYTDSKTLQVDGLYHFIANQNSNGFRVNGKCLLFFYFVMIVFRDFFATPLSPKVVRSRLTK